MKTLGLALILVLSIATHGLAFTWISENQNSSAVVVPTLSTTLTNVGTGHLIVVCAGYYSTSAASMTVSDGTSDFTPGTLLNQNNYYGQVFYKLESTAPSTGTVNYTVSFGMPTPSYPTVLVDELSYSGAAVVDAQANNTGNSLSAQSGYIDTTGNEEAVLACSNHQNGMLNRSIGGVVVYPTTGFIISGGYKADLFGSFYSSPQTHIQATGTLGFVSDYVMSIISFKTMPDQSPSADSLTPVNISTTPGIAQSFTAVYSDPNGYLNISDAALSLSGNPYNERVDYSPATNQFTLMGSSGDCSPGEAATLTDGYLTLDCSTSSASGSGTTLTLTFNLTPQPPLSGLAYTLMISVIDQGSLSNSKTPGTWIVNRPPSADSVSPMNSTTPTGTQQTFVSVYSDPDGWQNIAAANFYLSGNGGLHNEWLHYLVAPNLFTMLGTNDVCTPGQVKTLSNGFLTLNCSTSSISGSGTMLTVTYRVTPQPSSSGIQYNIFSAASDQAAAAFAIFAGTWGIQ